MTGPALAAVEVPPGKLSDDELRSREVRARSAFSAAERRLAQLQRRAGRALRERDAVNAELGEAVNVFVFGEVGELGLAGIAQAAGRIDRLARMLIAADAVPRAQEARERAHRLWRPLQREAYERAGGAR